MSTTVVTTTVGAGAQTKVVVTVNGKTVVELDPGVKAEEGVPPVSKSGGRSEEEKNFLIANYPKCLDDIKVEWLSALLGQTVRKMEIKVKLEAGVTGDAAIVGLEYAEGCSGPSSIVLKYAKNLEANRALAQEANMYEKETFFYTKLHGDVASVLPIPGVFDVFVDPEKPKEYFCIGMEDLNIGGYETCDQIIGMKWNDCNLLAKEVAKFHGRFWGAEILNNPVICGDEPGTCNVWFETWTKAISDTPGMVDTVHAILNPDGGNSNLPKSGGKLSLWPTDDFRTMLELWKANGHALIEEFHKILDSRPFTLTHGDLRADNIFRLGANGEATAFKVIDWQTYSAAAPGCDLTQLLAGSIPVEEMDHLPEILDSYIEVLHASCEEAKAYTLDMLKEDFIMTTTMLYVGLHAPFAGILEELPDGHPLWMLFDSCFGRYVKCCELLECPKFTIDTAERLGLKKDKRLPWFVPPEAKKPNPMLQSTDMETGEKIHRVHVRGIGVDGWDGTLDGAGAYENEASLKEIFGLFGDVKAVTIRHRIDEEAKKNTSWALVELDSLEAVEKVLAAVEPPRGLLAGSNVMKVTKFDKQTALASTGGMIGALEKLNSMMGAAMAAGTSQ